MTEPDTEISKGERVRARASRWVAFVLDDLIRIPGTNRRVGLDPLLGLLPGVGDFLSSAAGLTLLAAGARRRVPLSVYLRMTAHWILNALVGVVPVLGDVFSFWFKSNRRNYDLLRAHLDEAGPTEVRRAGWAPVVILVTAAALLFTALGFLTVWLFRLILG